MTHSRYEVIKDFPKQGGMSITSLASDNNLNRKVVLKRLNPSKVDTNELDKFVIQLREEALNQANLTHHNIAKVYDFFEDEGSGNIVMEFVDGDCLENRVDLINVSTGKQKLEEALNIIYQMIDGIIYAHKNKIVHRDIKLDNMMYCKETKTIKIIDFGLSKIKEQKRDGTVVFYGTEGYRPKELYDLLYGKRTEIDEEKRDIYCLGICIYRILTGQYPYDKATPEKFDKQTPYVSDYREDISEELNELFYSMIAINPEDRLDNLSVVLDAIRKQLRHGYTPLVKIPDFKHQTKIRDAIHGYIKLSKDETEIINNRFFQRLRNIKQLGTTYLVYPCAVHSRFEHSLGVMHIATKLFDNIASNNNDILGWDEEEIIKQRQMLRLLALLHDIGHAPFSHVGDNLFPAEVKNHESMSAKIIRESELSTLINKIGNKNGNFNFNEIAGLIEGKYLSQYSIIKQIFSGSVVDADRMDYLLRDSYMAGVKYGMYDLEHLIRSVNIENNFSNPILAIDIKGMYILEEFVLARYYMFNQVYYHKTRRIYDKTLEQCIISYLEINDRKKLPSDINEFIKLDDHKIMSYIKSHTSNHWNKMFIRRKHYKSIFEVFPVASNKDKNMIISIKDKIKESDIPNNKIIIDEYSKPPIVYRDEEGNPMIGLINRKGESLFIDEESYILKNMNEPTYLFRVYCEDSYISKVRKLIEEVREDVG